MKQFSSPFPPDATQKNDYIANNAIYDLFSPDLTRQKRVYLIKRFLPIFA